MAEKVKITFEIDGIQQSVSSVDELQEALKGVDTQAQKTEASLEEAADAAKDLGKESQDAGKNGEAGVKLIDEATGGLGTRFKEVGSAFKTLGTSMKVSFKAGVQGASALKKGLIATGIGAIVVALSLIVAYWDDIIGAISGVSAAEKQLMEDTQAEVQARQDGLDATLASENSLKLSGKSEKEIRDLKIQQTDEVINAMEAQLILQKEQTDAQVEAQQRNKDIAQNVIRLLTLPITMLLATVDSMTAAISKIPGVDISTNLEEGFSGGLAGLIFDPEETKKLGDEEAAEIDSQLAKLKNTRDGYILQGQAADQKAADDRKALKDKEAADEKARLEKAAADKKAIDDKAAADKKILDDQAIANRKLIDDLLQQADLDSIENQFEKARQELKIQQDLDMEVLKSAGATEAEINRIKASYTNKNKKLDKEEADNKKALREAEVGAALSATSGVFKDISGMMAEGSAAQKGFAVAAATIDTYQSANAAYKSMVGVPFVGPTLAPVAAGIAVAGGLLSIKKILAVKAPGSKGGGGGGGGSISPPAIPTFNPTTALNEATNADQDTQTEIGPAAQTGSTPSVVRAYVVSSEVSSQQEADAKIENLARL